MVNKTIPDLPAATDPGNPDNLFPLWQPDGKTYKGLLSGISAYAIAQAALAQSKLETDLSGGLVTAGTDDDYEIASARDPQVLADGFTIVFRTDRANTTTTPTLKASAATDPTALEKDGGDAPAIGDIVLGGVYQATYVAAADAFRLRSVPPHPAGRIPYDDTIPGLGRSTVQGAIEALAAAAEIYSGHLFGLTLANNAADSEHDIDIAVGKAVSNDANPVLMQLAAAFTKGLDAAFAEGSPGGGMVSGESLPTSGTVHVWLIMKADGTVDVCANNHATSGLSPTLPTGFVHKRRIGSLRTDGSGNIRGFVQTGDEFRLKAFVTDHSGAVSTGGGQSITLSVPNGIAVEALLRGAFFADAGTALFRLNSLDIADVAVSNSDQVCVAGTGGAGFGELRLKTGTARQVRARANASGSATIAAHGWIDSRGRLA